MGLVRALVPALIVLGDLNDEAEAATAQILLGPPGSEIGTGGYAMQDTAEEIATAIAAEGGP